MLGEELLPFFPLKYVIQEALHPFTLGRVLFEGSKIAEFVYEPC